MNAEADFKQVVAEHELEVNAAMKEPGEHRADLKNADHIGRVAKDCAAGTGRAQTSGFLTRRRDSMVIERRRTEKDGRSTEEPSVSPRSSPSRCRWPRRRPRQEQRAGDGRRTLDINPLAGLRAARILRQQRQANGEDARANRRVGEEDRVPVQRVGWDPAEKDTEAAAAPALRSRKARSPWRVPRFR